MASNLGLCCLQALYEQKNNIFIFLNQNIFCGYTKEPSQEDSSFEHPKHMLKLMDKKIFTILPSKNLLQVCVFVNVSFYGFLVEKKEC